MFSFELALGKEARKLMDLIIPMGSICHSKEVVEMVKGCEKKNIQAKELLEQVQK
jgi:6-phosphogluconolactonase/glucosamine-6-phosphate isomerase/deaminase